MPLCLSLALLLGMMGVRSTLHFILPASDERLLFPLGLLFSAVQLVGLLLAVRCLFLAFLYYNGRTSHDCNFSPHMPCSVQLQSHHHIPVTYHTLTAVVCRQLSNATFSCLILSVGKLVEGLGLSGARRLLLAAFTALPSSKKIGSHHAKLSDAVSHPTFRSHWSWYPLKQRRFIYWREA